MFLSKIKTDRRRWDVVHDLEDRDRLHKKILGLFPEIPGGPTNMRERRGVLYRVEGDGILLQSALEPMKERTPAGYALIAIKDVAAAYETIQASRVYRFRIEANTSMKVPMEQDSIGWVPGALSTTVETRRQTKRIGCGSHEERSKWFELAAKRSGFSLWSYSIDVLPMTRIGKEGRLETVRFEGLLKVVDRQLFMFALKSGIGQGKSYGLGLLSLRNP